MNLLFVILAISIVGAAFTIILAVLPNKRQTQQMPTDIIVPVCVAQHNFGVSANNRFVHKIYVKNAL